MTKYKEKYFGRLYMEFWIFPHCLYQTQLCSYALEDYPGFNSHWLPMKEDKTFLPYLLRHESTKHWYKSKFWTWLKGNNSMLVISLIRALCLRPETFCLAVQSMANATKIQNLIMLIFQNISLNHEQAIYSD